MLRDPVRLRVANEKVGADGNYFCRWKGSSGSVERWNTQKCVVKSAPRATSWTTNPQWRDCGSARTSYSTNALASWGSTIRQITTEIKFVQPIANLFSDLQEPEPSLLLWLLQSREFDKTRLDKRSAHGEISVRKNETTALSTVTR